MASTISLIAAKIPPPQSTHRNPRLTKHASVAPLPSRRQCLLLLTATTALKASEMPSRAQDIGLFGIRKKLIKVEEEAEQIVKEGFEAADKGIVAAEKGIEAAEVAAEKGIEAAEKEIEAELRVSALAQAGAVAAAEVVGVVIATSIVNAILGPEAQKS